MVFPFFKIWQLPITSIKRQNFGRVQGTLQTLTEFFWRK